MKNLNHKYHFAYWLLVWSSPFFLTGAATLVDPTRPPDNLLQSSTNISVSGPLELSAIYIHQNRRLAIISGQLATIGDKIGAYTIIQIQSDTVELKGSEENSVVLPLLPTVRKARVTIEG